MMDDLARGSGYQVAGMGNEHSAEFEWIAAFQWQGPGWYKEKAQPQAARAIFLRALAGKEGRPPKMRERYHAGWRDDLRDAPFDAAIVSGYASSTARQIMRDCRHRGIPVALWSDSNLRSDRGRSLRLRLKRALKRRILHRIAGSVNELLTANGRGVAFWRYYGGEAARSKIEICPYYADYARIDAASQTGRAQVLALAGLHPQDRYLFTAARLIPAKGLDLMLRAFISAGLAARGWKYLIAGTGPEEAALKEIASAAGEGAVRFVGFRQPSENLALMAHAEAMVLPSRYEPHGIVVPESLAAGTPVIVSSVVGAAHGLVKRGVNGLIFRSEDARELAETLRSLENPGRLPALRAATRPAFETWYRETSPMLVVPRAVRRMLAGRAR
jgi:glycosyltransferase involved in cell wall biosynthesis